jgi:hypothetical protein
VDASIIEAASIEKSARPTASIFERRVELTKERVIGSRIVRNPPFEERTPGAAPT